VQGHEIAYRRAGQGEPVLLVHGITTSSFMWDGVLDRLAADHDVVAVDLLGCGRSAKPLDTPYTLKDQARRLAALADALELGAVHYVGHDLGGGIGQILATRHPRSLRSLTMVNAVAFDFWPVQPILALRTPIIRQLLLATFDAGTFRLLIRRGLFHKELLTPQLFERFKEPLSNEAGRKAFLHFAKCLDSADLTSISGDLARLTIPTAVVWGMGDVYLPYAIAEKLVAHIPACRLVRIETAGHFSPIDEPDIVAGAVLQVAHGRA